MVVGFIGVSQRPGGRIDLNKCPFHHDFFTISFYLFSLSLSLKVLFRYFVTRIEREKVEENVSYLSCFSRYMCESFEVKG